MKYGDHMGDIENMDLKNLELRAKLAGVVVEATHNKSTTKWTARVNKMSYSVIGDKRSALIIALRLFERDKEDKEKKIPWR